MSKNKWEKRDKKQKRNGNSKKAKHVMRGKGMLRIETELYWKKVYNKNDEDAH